MLLDLGIPYRAEIIADRQDHDVLKCSGHFKVDVAGSYFLFDCFGQFLSHGNSSLSTSDFPSKKITAILGNSVDPWFEFDGSKSDNERGTEFIEDSELPMLVLATRNDFKFKEPHKWRAVSHQHGGLACDHTNMMIMVLDQTELSRELIHGLNKEFYDSAGFWPSLDVIVKYRSFLSGFGVDCNSSYRNFSEALYPVDATEENIKKLAKDQLPEDLNDLVDWGSDDLAKMFGIINRWELLILGENSD